MDHCIIRMLTSKYTYTIGDNIEDYKNRKFRLGS